MIIKRWKERPIPRYFSLDMESVVLFGLSSLVMLPTLHVYFIYSTFVLASAIPLGYL